MVDPEDSCLPIFLEARLRLHSDPMTVDIVVVAVAVGAEGEEGRSREMRKCQQSLEMTGIGDYYCTSGLGVVAVPGCKTPGNRGRVQGCASWILLGNRLVLEDTSCCRIHHRMDWNATEGREEE